MPSTDNTYAMPVIEIKPRTTAAPSAGAECTDPNCKLCAGWPPEPPTDEQSFENKWLKAAMATLEHHLKADLELAWGWHCNIAMAIYDSGARPHSACNKGAAHFLSLLFPGVDTTKHPAYASTQQPPVANDADSGGGMTLGEAIEVLRQGKRMRHEDWEEGGIIQLGADGKFHDEDGDSVDWVVTFYDFTGCDNRPYQLVAAPVPSPDLTTAESLAALAEGKRVRQVHPHDGGVWQLKDGYFQCSKGTVCDAVTITATDLLQSRYRVEA